MRYRRAAVVLVAAITSLSAACASDDPTTAATPEESTSTVGSAPSTVPTGELPTLQLVDLGLDVDQPIDLTTRPGSTSLLVAERGGRVREAVADGDGFRLVDTPVLDLTDRVGSTDAEKGLLGIAVSPEGDQLYASYTESSEGDSRVDAYDLGGTDGALRADPASRRQLAAIEQPFANHNGGSLAVGPDGMLYAGFGDGGAANDPAGRAQDRATQLGKVLRLDPAARDDTDGDGYPDDNPDLDGAPGIWISGVRNPWRMSFDPTTGDLWIADVGQDAVEEVNLLPADEGGGRGANLGWDLYEGDRPFEPGPGPPEGVELVAPVHTYDRSAGGCSVTGGVVYRGSAVPALVGTYLFGDFCDPALRGLRPAGEGSFEPVELGLQVDSLVSFGTGPDGEVYVVGLDGTVARIAPA